MPILTFRISLSSLHLPGHFSSLPLHCSVVPIITLMTIGEVISFLAKELQPPELTSNVTGLIDSMRTRQLRSFLVKLGADRLEIDKLMLREELEGLAHQLVQDENQEKVNNYQIRVAYYVTIFLGVLVLAYVLKNLFFGILEGILQFFSGELYQIRLKLKTMKMAVKNFRVVAIMGLLLSVLCDGLVNWIQISILASWVLPRHSFLRNYLIQTFSLPMSPAQLLGAGSSAFALDMGPMLTLWGLRWLSKQFEEVVGGSLIDIADRKWSKKQAKMNKHKARDGYARSGTFFNDDSPFIRRREDEDLESIKGRFFGNRSRERNNFSSNAAGATDHDKHIDDYSDHLPEFLKGNKNGSTGGGTSILEEREEGDILNDAFEDGSSVICEKCGDLVKRERMDIHVKTWCSMNEESDTMDID